MEQEKRNQYIVVGTILILLFGVLIFFVYTFLNSHQKNNQEVKIKYQQIYSSDYRLTFLGDNYFIGSYSKEDKNNVINVIIDGTGTEIIKNTEDIYYDNIFKMKDGRYLIYNNLNNILNMYIFDGKMIVRFQTIENVSYVKPILYKSNEESYIIGFASMADSILQLYSLYSQDKVILENKSLVGDMNVNGLYYTYNENYLVVKDNSGLMGVVDIKGNQIIDYQYKNIINTNNDSFIAISKKNKYGIIGKENNVLLRFNYDVISRFDNKYLVVDGKKMAVYDQDYKNITGFKLIYDSLLEYDLRSTNNSIYMYNINETLVVLNNYMELNNGTEFDNHNLYVIKDGKITKNIKQVGFGYEDVIYSIDNNFNIVIYDNNFEEMFKFKIDNLKKIISVKMVNNDIYEIEFYDDAEKLERVNVNSSGEVISNIGKLVFNTEKYYIVNFGTEENMKLIIYNKENERMDELAGDNFEIYGYFVIGNNSIYKINII